MHKFQVLDEKDMVFDNTSMKTETMKNSIHTEVDNQWGSSSPILLAC